MGLVAAYLEKSKKPSKDELHKGLAEFYDNLKSS